MNQKPTVSFRLDDEIIEALEKISAEKGISKSELVRQILEEYIGKE